VIPAAAKTTVSVALCTYDGAAYLEEQLASILGQSVPPDEIVVGDDGSRDETLDLLASFAGTGAPIRVLEGTAGGPTRNFARTMGATTGDVLFLSDQDDVWAEDKVERVLAAFEAAPTATCCISDATLVDASRRPLGPFWEGRLGFGPSEVAAFRGGEREPWLLRRTIAFGATMALRWPRIRSVASPIPEAGWGHDNWAACVAAFLGSVVLVDAPLIEYRQHGDQYSSAGGGQGVLQAVRRWRGGPARNSSITPDAGAYLTLFRRLAPHLADAEEPAPATRFLGAVLEKHRHAEAREALAATRGWRRLEAVGEELLRGHYHRFSNGLYSVARDLWV
jgi:hypothetical protein